MVFRSSGEMLDAEHSLFNVELFYTNGQKVLFRSLINIYKSMGDGWVAAAEDGMPAQPVMETGSIPATLNQEVERRAS